MRANPIVRLRIRGGTFSGIVRELGEGRAQEAMDAYCETVNPFDYAECVIWRSGRPTRAKIKELHRSWFAHGDAAGRRPGGSRNAVAMPPRRG